MKTAIAGLGLLFCAGAFAQEVVMFGEVAIGKPLTIQPCSSGYEAMAHPLCTTKARAGNVFVEFPQREAPTYIGELPPVLYLKDNIVVGMDIFTNGVLGQQPAYEALTAKFGKPSYKDSRKVTTLAGVQHDSIGAKWKVGDVSVIFSGTNGTSTDGIITIGTAQLSDVRQGEKRREM